MNPYTIHALTANEALTIGRHVLHIADERKLHPSIRRAADGVRAKLDVLDAASPTVEKEGDPPNAGVGEAMFALRGTLSRFAGALHAFGDLPVEDGLVVAAREAYSAIFPQGTTFLVGTAADVEVEGGRTLERARERATAASLKKLGFAPVVKQATKELRLLRAASEAAAAVPEERPREGQTRFDALLDATGALREYARVVQAVDVVEGTSDRHELLAPFVHGRATKAKRARAPMPDATPRANDVERDEAPPSRAA